MIAANTDRLGRVNASELLRDVDALIARDGGLGAAVEKEVAMQLGAPGYKAMINATYLTKASDGDTLSFSRNAPSIKDYFDGKQGASGTAHYAKLDRLWGDGNAKTFDGEKISAGIQDLLKSGLSLTQYENLQQSRATAAANQASSANAELAADLGQLGLDIVGIFDPTPTADLINAGISAWRGDGWGAFLSTLSAVPYVGDLAKLGKLGDWAQTVTKAIDAAASNATARAMLSPALRKVSDLIGALPSKAFEVLPAEAKATLLEMKGKIDGLLGKVGKKADDVAIAAVNTVQRAFGENSVKWITDGEGRLVSASANLKEVFPSLTRSADEVTAQSNMAKKGIEGDHGGHAVPHRFLGDQGSINMFPQNGVPVGAAKNFNGSAFKTLENELADWVQAGATVKYDVNFSNFAGKRPNTVGIEYKVFDKTGNEVFRNGRRFKNEAGQIFERVSREKIETILNGAAK